MLIKLAIPLTFALLITAGFVRTKGMDSEVATQYHHVIADTVERIPLDFEGWIGQDVPLPPAAINLLRPNAILAREYYNQEHEIYATLLVVQCRDIRDMAGHYPPVCYPAHGWTSSESSVPIRTIRGELMKPYVFEREMGEQDHSITVYNLFALPTGDTTISMSVVRSTGSDYQFRPYGAAQIQVVLTDSVQLKDHQWILEEMYSIASPTVDAVVDSDAREGGEGDE